MLSPTQQSYALIAAHTALFTTGGFLSLYKVSTIAKSTREPKDKEMRSIASIVLIMGACFAIAIVILPSHNQIWSSACLCDSTTPGAKKFLIEYINEHARPEGYRIVYALSSDLFYKYVNNEQFYSRCSAGSFVAGIILPTFAKSYFY